MEQESKQFFRVYKDVVNSHGIDIAVLYGMLIDSFHYAKSIHRVYDGYFYVPIESVKNFAGYSPKTQRKYFDILKNDGLIEIKYYGMPRKRMVKLPKIDFYQLDT